MGGGESVGERVNEHSYPGVSCGSREYIEDGIVRARVGGLAMGGASRGLRVC